MANLSKVKLGSTIYSLKDTEARAAVTALQTAVASALIFKGVVSSAADIENLETYQIGWTYKANTSFLFAGSAVENGDMVICIKSKEDTYQADDWTIVQNNVDVMVGATAETDGTTGLVPRPGIDDINKFLRGDGSWQNTYPSGGREGQLLIKTATGVAWTDGGTSSIYWGSFLDLQNDSVPVGNVEWGSFAELL